MTKDDSTDPEGIIQADALEMTAGTVELIGRLDAFLTRSRLNATAAYTRFQTVIQRGDDPVKRHVSSALAGRVFRTVSTAFEMAALSYLDDLPLGDYIEASFAYAEGRYDEGSAAAGSSRTLASELEIGARAMDATFIWLRKVLLGPPASGDVLDWAGDRAHGYGPRADVIAFREGLLTMVARGLQAPSAGELMRELCWEWVGRHNRSTVHAGEAADTGMLYLRYRLDDRRGARLERSAIVCPRAPAVLELLEQSGMHHVDVGTIQTARRFVGHHGDRRYLDYQLVAQARLNAERDGDNRWQPVLSPPAIPLKELVPMSRVGRWSGEPL